MGRTLHCKHLNCCKFLVSPVPACFYHFSLARAVKVSSRTLNKYGKPAVCCGAVLQIEICEVKLTVPMCITLNNVCFFSYKQYSSHASSYTLACGSALLSLTCKIHSHACKSHSLQPQLWSCVWHGYWPKEQHLLQCARNPYPFAHCYPGFA